MISRPEGTGAQPASYKICNKGLYVGLFAHSFYVLTEVVMLE